MLCARERKGKLRTRPTTMAVREYIRVVQRLDVDVDGEADVGGREALDEAVGTEERRGVVRDAPECECGAVGLLGRGDRHVRVGNAIRHRELRGGLRTSEKRKKRHVAATRSGSLFLSKRVRERERERERRVCDVRTLLGDVCLLRGLLEVAEFAPGTFGRAACTTAAAAALWHPRPTLDRRAPGHARATKDKTRSSL